jgi:hypothetical protein
MNFKSTDATMVLIWNAWYQCVSGLRNPWKLELHFHQSREVGLLIFQILGLFRDPCSKVTEIVYTVPKRKPHRSWHASTALARNEKPHSLGTTSLMVCATTTFLLYRLWHASYIFPFYTKVRVNLEFQPTSSPSFR